MPKKISVVVPVYNEQDNIKAFYDALTGVMKELNYDYELIFVDDGSKDAGVYMISQLIDIDERVNLIMLSRNFGHQIALTCGMDNADGDAVITMDGDLQHPPELIPHLVAKWEQGFEVVQTVRVATKGVNFLKKATSFLYYKVINLLARAPIVEGGSDFRLLDSKVVKAFRLYRERGRFIRGLISTLGFKQCQVRFVAPARHAGVSKFSLSKMLHFALDGITSLSTVPLRFAFYIGICLGIVSLGLTAHVIYVRLFTDEAVLGWATLAAYSSFIGGVQLIGLGILGEYTSRIFQEVKQRPLYLVSKKIGTGSER